MLVAIIPASGSGVRYGKPKIFARIDGRTFLELIQETLSKAGIDEVLVARDLNTSSMLESIRAVVSSVIMDSHFHGNDSPVTAYLIFPVDHPLVTVKTVVMLRDAHQRHPELVLRPVFEGRKGHPIVIPANLDLWVDDENNGLAGIIQKTGIKILDLETDDENILRNLNFPPPEPI